MPGFKYVRSRHTNTKLWIYCIQYLISESSLTNDDFQARDPDKQTRLQMIMTV